MQTARPISAEEFLNNLFGELPNLFKSEDELRTLWSNPLTRRTLLEKLDDAGFGKDELTTLQKLIDAEKSDLFDVLEYVFNSDYQTNDKGSKSCSSTSHYFRFA